VRLLCALLLLLALGCQTLTDSKLTSAGNGEATYISGSIAEVRDADGKVIIPACNPWTDEAGKVHPCVHRSTVSRVDGGGFWQWALEAIQIPAAIFAASLL
jgi:hypothetical protein